jgi:hypothetical protein
MESKIKAIGLEIEGEWSPNLQSELTSRYEIQWHDDGSVEHCYELRTREGLSCENLDTREGVTWPIPYNQEGLEKIKDLFAYLHSSFQDGKAYHWNRSCGFHIHFSFTPKEPPELLSLAFADYLKEQIITKYPKVYELRKGISYCSFNPLLEKNIGSTAWGRLHSNRYHYLNTMVALREHGTIELRAFPADEPKKMKDYFDFSVNTINEFIDKANNEGILNREYVINLEDIVIPPLEITDSIIMKKSRNRNIIDTINLIQENV